MAKYRALVTTHVWVEVETEEDTTAAIKNAVLTELDDFWESHVGDIWCNMSVDEFEKTEEE